MKTMNRSRIISKQDLGKLTAQGLLNRIDELEPDKLAIQSTRFFEALDTHAQAIADAIQAVDAAILALTLNPQPSTSPAPVSGFRSQVSGFALRPSLNSQLSTLNS